MKAFLYHQYGTPDELRLAEIDRPVPNEGDVLLKIHAVSINGSDRENLVGRPLYTRIGGLRKPVDPVLGSDIAGVVVQVGQSHTDFKVGDEVFGELLNYRGGFAEYAVTSGAALMKKPAKFSFEEAAAIPQAGVIAYKGIIEAGNLEPGKAVLINGAGGSAGSYAIQLAKLQGAEVTAVDHGRKADFMRSLGADHVIDYTREDFTRTGKRYDLILDMIAHKTPFAYRRALTPKGAYFFTGGSVRTLFGILIIGSLLGRFDERKIKLLGVPQNRADLESITAYCVDGRVKTVIDRIFPFEETIEAMRYVNSPEAQGKVVISMEDGVG